MKPQVDLGTRCGFRPPRQERSRVTVERIVRATQDLLTERGPTELTVEQIVGRADSSVGSFYARFDDRAAAVRYVQDRFWTDIEERWDAYLGGPDWGGKSALEIVARVTRDLVRAMMADRDRLRAFLVLALANPESGLVERTAEVDRRISRGVAELLERADRALPGGLPAQAIEAGFERVLGALRDAVVFGDGSERASRELALSLVRMYGASLDLNGLPRSWPELLTLCSNPTKTR